MRLNPADAGAPPPRRVPCPTCRREAEYAPSNPWRPFCSERCRQLDLGAWASERFRVETPIAREDDEPEV